MQTKEIMQEAARAALAILPEGVGLSLFVWNPGDPGTANYIRTADRHDVITAVKAFIRRNEEGRIVHTSSGN
jgi:hypothetical protein